MISQIGINKTKLRPAALSILGFTFIEVMVTLAVLSFGMVVIFKGFFHSLDQINYLTDRLYASSLLDDRLSETQRALKIDNAIPTEEEQEQSVDIGPHDVHLTRQIKVLSVENLSNIFYVELIYSWQDHGRSISLSRGAYLVSWPKN